jgi:hypothetical protein
MSNKLKRRSFVKLSAALGSFLGISSKEHSSIDDLIDHSAESYSKGGKSLVEFKVDPIPQVRLGFIGVGNRGSNHLEDMIALGAKVKIVAVSDIQEKYTKRANEVLENKGVKDVTYYHTQKEAWKALCDRDDIDLVIISTPWEDHVPMALYAMNKGKHVAVEVPIAYTLKDCWDLVNTAEATQRHCFMMENVCYGDEELWLLNMVDQGVFGTLTYAECAYIHDLRSLLFDEKGYYYNMWRLKHNIERDGNLYPTHGLGPVAQYLDINRGDKFDYLVSMSSLQAGLTEDDESMTDPSSPYHNLKNVKHGDMNNCLIKTNKGRTILLQHDIVTSRPYNRINMLAGTRAFHKGYPSQVSLKSQDGHKFLPKEEYDKLKNQYKHPIWTKMKAEIEKNGGHGGMDFVMNFRLIDCLNKGLPLDMDVYDGVAWSVVTPLSELSIKGGSKPVKFPDFTNGAWKSKRKLGIMG